MSRKYAQAQKFSLSVGISTTDTSITLQSFNFPDGTAIASGDLGAVNYGTLEPGTTREEQISFTGITTNADNTVTLTGVTRGIGFGAVDTYSEQSDLKVQHGAGSVFILSNTAGFYNDFVNKYNDETISGTLSVPTPTSGSHAVTKDYADGLTTATDLPYDRIIQAGTAGESLTAGDLVYFDDTDNEWKKTNGTSAATLNNVLLGIAQGTGSDGGSINGGVLTYGLDSTQTGLTVGVKLYASDTAGAIAESAGTTERVIGWSKSATEIYFDANVEYTPTADEKDAMAGGGDFGTVSSSNKFLTEDYKPLIGEFGDGSDGDVTISSPTGLSRDMYYDNLTVNDTLTTNGYRIFVKGTLTGTGTIKYPDANDGGNASGQTAGTAGAATTVGGYLKNVAGTAGGNGGAGTTGGAGNVGLAGTDGDDGYIGGNAGAGGAGGAGGSAGGSGGTAGTDISNQRFGVESWNTLPVTELLASGLVIRKEPQATGGGGGGGAGSGSASDGGGGGGGGASGGIVWIAARTWAGTFTIQAGGGNGGNGGDAGGSGAGGGGGGAGGNGGVTIVIYGSKSWTGSYSIAGGTAGAAGAGSGGSDGTAGAAGTTGTSYEIPANELM